jgi:ubiquinone/menaquinone biosynthesis C-methylase UbiE
MNKAKNSPSKKPDDTSWNKVAGWYDELLTTDNDSYQSKVIAPNLLRILNLKKGEQVYDLACGQGYFADLLFRNGASVVASDLSRKLVSIATETLPKDIKFYVSKADQAQFIKDKSIDTVVIVLAIQNIENVNGVFAECNRILKDNGRIVLVINHPAFRVPQGSDWYFKDGVQYRIVGKYLSESKISIDMTPGEKDIKKKVKTISFHRPLQYYVKLLSKNGFAVARLEEWISHKKSQKGPRQISEDTARKEIPIFMCLEVRKI